MNDASDFDPGCITFFAVFFFLNPKTSFLNCFKSGHFSIGKV